MKAEISTNIKKTQQQTTQNWRNIMEEGIKKIGKGQIKINGNLIEFIKKGGNINLLKDQLVKDKKNLKIYLRLGMLPFSHEVSFYGASLIMEKENIKIMKTFANKIVEVLKKANSINEFKENINKEKLFYSKINNEFAKLLLEDKDLFLYGVLKDYEVVEKLDELKVNVKWHYLLNKYSFLGGKIDAHHFLFNIGEELNKEKVNRITKIFIKKGLNPFSPFYENYLVLKKFENWELLEKAREIFRKAYDLSIEKREIISEVKKLENVNGSLVYNEERTIHLKVNPQRFAKEINNRGREIIDIDFTFEMANKILRNSFRIF